VNKLQIIITTISVIVAIPSLIWLWLNNKKKSDKHKATAETCKRLISELSESKTKNIKTKEKLEFFRELFNSANDMVFVFGVTEDGKPTKLLSVNDAICKKLEYTREQMLNMTLLEIETVSEPVIGRAPSDIELLTLSNEEILAQDSKYASHNMQQLLKRIHNDEEVIHKSHFVTRSQRSIPVQITAHKFGKYEDNTIVCSVRDISAKEENERNLRSCKQEFNNLFSKASTGIAIYDELKSLTNVNHACLRIFGSPGIEEFKKIDIFNSHFLPDSAKEDIKRGHSTQCEVIFDFDELIKSHSVISSRHGKAHLNIFFDYTGDAHGQNSHEYLIQVHDMTELRQTEEHLKTCQDQLRQAQKMEAIGTMTSGIAHDFNNILTPILGYSDVGIELTSDDDPMHGFLREIKKSTMRAKELVHQILIFSRQSEDIHTMIHLIPIVKEVTKQQSVALPGNIKVSFSARTNEDLVIASPTQIHQTLTNFCTNAAYAMKESGGNLDIILTLFTMGWRHRQEFPQLKKGRYIRISIKDTGKGIPQDIREKIFTPFFSTKPSGEGTGMGLAVVHDIINSLEGGITLVSEEGEGTTFHIALPLCEAETDDETKSWTAPEANDECILFVDDEQGIAKMAAHMLSSLGYKPITATSSPKALKLFQENPDKFNLLITDQVMPEISGSELAAEIRKIRPDLPVIICSGFSGTSPADKAGELGVDEFLVKPISRKDIGESIKRVIGK